MNRSMRAALGVVLVALAVPTAALATHHSADGFRPHGHHRHGGRGGSSVTSGATGAGSVQSYDGQTGALTILLPGNGGTITGTVTDRTRFECPHQSQGGGWGHGGRRRGVLIAYDSGASGDSGSSGASGSSGSSGDTGASGWTGHHGRWGASGDSGPSGDTGASGSTGGRGGWGSSGDAGTDGSGPPHHHHFHYSPPPPCDSSLLTQGVSLLGAQLELTGNGVFFEGLELLPAVQ